MKKIFTYCLLIFILLSCEKKDDSLLTVVNNSDYPANITIVPYMDLSGAKTYIIAKSETRILNYPYKADFYIFTKPYFTRYTDSNNVITIMNTDKTLFYKGSITNKLSLDITLVNNGIADVSKNYIDDLTIPAGETKQVFFCKKISNGDIVVKDSKNARVGISEENVTPTATEKQNIAYKITIY